WGIGGYAKQHGARLLNLSICVAEPASLNGSTGGVRAGIEEQNYRLAAQVFERDFGAVLILQSEVGSLIIDFHAKFSANVEIDQDRDLPRNFLKDFTLRNFAERGGNAARRCVPFCHAVRRGAGRASADHAGRTQARTQEGHRPARIGDYSAGEEWEGVDHSG